MSSRIGGGAWSRGVAMLAVIAGLACISPSGVAAQTSGSRTMAAMDRPSPSPRPRVEPRPRFDTAVAGADYEAGGLHSWLLGPHYRSLWTQPVTVEYLDLDQFGGGLVPVRTGGGMQTRSLRFEGADGRTYAFRSVDKNPAALLDTLLHGTVVHDLVQDGISAAHPYAALVAAPLLDAAGVPAATPELLVMPDDPRLGAFRTEFAGMLGFLEERPDENDGGASAFRGAKRVIGSEKLTERLNEDPDERVDARAFLRARLMDVFLGDWDRHRGQWRWATWDDESPRRWHPIPRDRDQAFSHFDGVVTSLAGVFVPQFVRFGPEYPAMDRMHWNGRALDRWFLAELDREAWDAVGAAVRASLTDSVIEASVRRLPPEIQEMDGASLASILRARRDGLGYAVSEFYELLAEQVDVQATDAAEMIRVQRRGDGAVTVTLAPRDDVDAVYFHRTFFPDETREVRIHARGGDDRVVVAGISTAGPTVHLVGGAGDDSFVFQGEGGGVHVYDDEGADQVLGEGAPSLDRRGWTTWEWSPEDRDQPRDWGRRTTPLFWSSYGTDLGVFVGAGVRVERYGFRHPRFSSALEVRGGYAPAVGKGRLEVGMRFNRPNAPLYFTLAGRFSELDVLHWYGLGNDTPPGSERYHRVDLGRATATAAMGFSPGEGMDVTALVEVERTETHDASGRFFGVSDVVQGRGPRTTVGLGARMVLDPWAGRNDAGHGIRFSLDGMVHPSGFGAASTFGEAGAEVSALLASSSWPAISLHVRGGARQIFGRFPWHRSAFVGGGETIRGWDEQRFAGDASVNAGGELRLRALEPRVVVPAALGVFGFADAGRVFLDGASPGGWHTGFGGGIYFQPALQPLLARLGAATSAETTKFFLSVGLPY